MEYTKIKSVSAESFCDRVKLNDFNKTQSHGGILLLDENLYIKQYSENIPHLLETPIDLLLASPVTTFLKSATFEILISWLSEKNSQYKRLEWKSPKNTLTIWTYLHQNDEGILIELGPIIENQNEDSSFFSLAQFVVESMKSTNQCDSIQQLVKATCEEIRNFTQFDRVLVYQFDPNDHSGIVVGESLDADMESFMGLRFPASDIPKPVRDMYLRVSIRYIPTIYDKPQKLINAHGHKTNFTVDLANTNLRMVAPVHVEYLKNMGLEASTSIAITYDNKLWGIIACHHRKPKFLSVNVRLMLVLIGTTVGTQILALERSSKFHEEQKVIELQAELTKNVSLQDSLVQALDGYHTLMMNLVGAEGMSVYFQNNLISYGLTPNQQQTMALISWLPKKSSAYHTSFLAKEFPSALEYDRKICGLLALPLAALENNYLLFFRKEVVESVSWAGNPSDVIRTSDSTYSPRASFKRFMETIKDHSLHWSTADIGGAEFVSTIIINKMLQDLLQVQAMHDSLTGLYNRLYLEQQLTIEINRASRSSLPLAILLVDLDFFKKINDSFGHQAGDLVLTEFAKLLKSHFQGFDCIYRYGGEEFLILLPEITASECLRKAESLQAEIIKLKIQFADTVLPPLTVSGGISTFPESGEDARSLIAAADKALYQAKASGRKKIMMALKR